MSIQKQTFRSGPYADFIAQGVRVGGVLYLSGQVGTRGDGTPGADLTEQVSLAYQNLRAVLAEFGATMENIVDETVFVTDMEELNANAEQVFSVRAQAYGGTPEVTQTLVQVAALFEPEWKLEIKCTAHV